MPNDSKFGLFIGISLVLAVAVLFFQKEPAPSMSGQTAAVSLPSATPSETPTPAATLSAPTPPSRPAVGTHPKIVTTARVLSGS